VTAKRNRPKAKLTEEMTAEVVLDDATYEDDETTDDDPEGTSTRRIMDKRADTPKKSKLDLTEQLTRIFASIGVGSAALLGYWQYAEANDALRSERSFELVQNWQKDEHIDNFTTVQDFVETKLSTVETPPTGLKPEALRQASADAKQCDPEVLRVYFQSEVVSFWQYFSGYATLRQEANYQRYGKPVEDLVNRFQALDPK